MTTQNRDWTKLWDDLSDVLKKHNFATFADLYWTVAIEDRLQCWEGYRDLFITDDESQQVVDCLLDDNMVWNTIDSAIDYYLQQVVEGRNKK